MIFIQAVHMDMKIPDFAVSFRILVCWKFILMRFSHFLFSHALLCLLSISHFQVFSGKTWGFNFWTSALPCYSHWWLLKFTEQCNNWFITYVPLHGYIILWHFLHISWFYLWQNITFEIFSVRENHHLCATKG